MGVIRSPRTAVHLVTLLEEMPVQGRLSTASRNCASRLPVGAVIVNMERGPRLPPDGLAAALNGRSTPPRSKLALRQRACHAS